MSEVFETLIPAARHRPLVLRKRSIQPAALASFCFFAALAALTGRTHVYNWNSNGSSEGYNEHEMKLRLHTTTSLEEDVRRLRCWERLRLVSAMTVPTNLIKNITDGFQPIGKRGEKSAQIKRLMGIHVLLYREERNRALLAWLIKCYPAAIKSENRVFYNRVTLFIAHRSYSGRCQLFAKF